jgi:hypothetical protein
VNSHVVHICSGLLERVGRRRGGVLMHKLSPAFDQPRLERYAKCTNPCELRLKLSQTMRSSRDYQIRREHRRELDEFIMSRRASESELESSCYRPHRLTRLSTSARNANGILRPTESSAMMRYITPSAET